MPKNRPDVPVACFDLDGTLVKSDTFLPFLISFAIRKSGFWRLPMVPIWLFCLTVRMVSAQQAKDRLITLFFNEQKLSEIAEHAEWFWQKWVKRRLNPPMIAKLESHRILNDRLILISASPDIYVPTLAKRLGINEVLCTTVGRSDMVCTGRITGENCKGESKVIRLLDHLGVSQIPPASSAYGDSLSDLPLLRAVDYGFLVKGSTLKPLVEKDSH